MSKRSENLLKGFYDVLPLLLPVVPFGIIFGAIGVELGFGPYVTYATSIIIFSGASQIVFFQLLSNGASSLVAITSSSVISTRHLLYGAVVAQYLSKLSITWKIFISYLLTDQAFAVSQEYFKKNKDVLFINLAFFIIDYYFSNLNKDNSLNNDKIYEVKNYFFKNLNIILYLIRPTY